MALKMLIKDELYNIDTIILYNPKTQEEKKINEFKYQDRDVYGDPITKEMYDTQKIINITLNDTPTKKNKKDLASKNSFILRDKDNTQEKTYILYINELNNFKPLKPEEERTEMRAGYYFIENKYNLIGLNNFSITFKQLTAVFYKEFKPNFYGGTIKEIIKEVQENENATEEEKKARVNFLNNKIKEGFIYHYLREEDTTKKDINIKVFKESYTTPEREHFDKLTPKICCYNSDTLNPEALFELLKRNNIDILKLKF